MLGFTHVGNTQNVIENRKTVVITSPRTIVKAFTASKPPKRLEAASGEASVPFELYSS